MCETYSERRTWMLYWILSRRYFTKAQLLEALSGQFSDLRIGTYETVPEYLRELVVDGVLANQDGYFYQPPVHTGREVRTTAAA